MSERACTADDVQRGSGTLRVRGEDGERGGFKGVFREVIAVSISGTFTPVGREPSGLASGCPPRWFPYAY